MRALVIATTLFAAHAASANPTGGTATEALLESPDAVLSRAQQSYARSDYDGTIAALKPLLYPTVRIGADDEVRARRELAMSYYFQRDVNLAEEEFTTLLQLNPNFALDPIEDPPKALEFLETIRQRNRQKLDEMAEQRRREETERQQEHERLRRESEEAARRSLKPLIIERTIEQHHLPLAFVPFGVGQLQNVDHAKAWLFLSTEAALGAASLGLWTWYYFNHTSNPIVRWVPAMIGTAFWIDALAGIVDALANFKAQVVVDVAPVPPPPRSGVGVAPFVAPGGGGLTLQGVF